VATATIVIEATYENGVFRPDGAVPLRNNERVRIEIRPVNMARATFGLMGWTGDSAQLQELALSPENAPEDAP